MSLIAGAVRGGIALTRLSLRSCGISKKAFSELSQALCGDSRGGKSQKSHLVVLDLAKNKISSDSAEELSNAILKGGLIDQLNVAGCNMGKKALLMMCEMIKQSKSLTKIYLDANDWSNSTLEELAIALELNSRLELLSLRAIGVSAKDIADFIASLSESLSLQTLNVE